MDDIVDELTGQDYVNTPLKELCKHPDFTAKAMTIITDILGMTTAQIENLMKEGS